MNELQQRFYKTLCRFVLNETISMRVNSDWLAEVDAAAKRVGVDRPTFIRTATTIMMEDT